jgi:hypothetical protein
MKQILFLLFFILLCSPLQAQSVQKPEWVRLFQQGKTYTDTTDSYVGIGSSALSQEDADARSRHDFAMSVEVRVQSAITRNIQEVDNITRDEYTASAQMSSDIVLRGVNITERYQDQDEKKFYALIKLQKSVFDTLLATEIRRDLERKKAENRVMEDKRREEIRSQQASLELTKKEEETRKEELALKKQLYDDFLKMKAPDQVVDMRNGEIPGAGCTLAARMSISPFNIRSAYLALALWHFELLTRAEFQAGRFLESDMFRREEALVKVQLLKHAGEIYKTSLAFGVVGYARETSLKALGASKPKYSIFATGDVGLPEALSSYASIYVDARKISAGLNCFPFPGHFQDAVSILLQADYVWNRDWRDRFQDPLLVEAGVRFRASERFATSFTYEENEFLVFAVEVGL